MYSTRILYFVLIRICDITQETKHMSQGLRMCRGSTVDEYCDNEGHSLPHYSSRYFTCKSAGSGTTTIFAELSQAPLTNS